MPLVPVRHSLAPRLSLLFTTYLLFGLLLTTEFTSAASTMLQVRYYYGGTVPDYAIKVMRLALDKNGQPYQLKSVPGPMTTPRIIHSIRSNNSDKVNVLWAASSRTLEQSLKAIPIPIDRGLIGYRVLVIRKAAEARISDIRSLSDLKSLSMLQGLGWGDVELLRHNGFQVIEAPPEQLYAMLDATRGDAFPRSVLDVERELQAQHNIHPILGMDTNVALIYPHYGVYFFVSPDNKVLHDALERGLKIAMTDGSFNKLYAQDRNIQAALHLIEQPRRVFTLQPKPGASSLQSLPPQLFEPRLKQGN